jgi:hypothetical protein
MMSAKPRCTGIDIRLAVGVGALVPLLFFGSAGVAVGTPGTLTDGTYLVSFGDGPTETWTITSSCGIGCAVVDSSLGWSEHADIAPGGYWAPTVWVINVPGPDAAICPDGTRVAGRQSYSFDPTTLTGKKGSGFNNWPDCDGHGGGYGHQPPPTVPFTMTKTG